MNRTCFVWQFDNISSSNVPLLLAGQGFNRAAVKALDGNAWMREFDKSPDAIGGPADLASWQQAFLAHGLLMDVWVCPHPDALDQQRLIWRSLLGFGRLIFDLEPYADFWGPEDCSSLAPFIAANRVVVSFDPRRLDWPGIGACLDAASYQLPQLYDRSWIGACEASERGHSTAILEPILSTSQSAADWRSILRDSTLGSLRGRSGFGVWRAPVLDQEHIRMIGSMA